MKNKWFAISTLVIVLFASSLAHAESPWVKEPTYTRKTVHKLIFGLRNVVFGWTEIWTEPLEANDEGRNPFAAIGTGLVNFVGQTLGGALHVVTFPIPVDIPLPEGGVNF